MAYRVELTEPAEADIDEITLYIAGELQSPDAAIKFYAAFFEKLEGLDTYPYKYEKSRSEKLSAEGYRRFYVNGYVVLYKVSEKDKQVNIMRVFYSGRDYEKLL